MSQLLCLLFGSVFLFGTCTTACIPSGDETVINNLFVSGGANTVVSLCPSAVFNLKQPVVFTAPNQELSTQGYPTDDTRTTLIVTGVNQTAALMGNCAQCSGIKLRNIRVNGNRPALGMLRTLANIEMGGPNSDQLVEYVHSYEPRGWSCMHIARSGDSSKLCTGAIIKNNDIGPSGHPQQWGDGISVSCTKTLVENNVITDASAGAIVVFGAPYSTVRNNTIIAISRDLLGGINMVDYTPYSGNYTGTLVTNNTIWAKSAYIKIVIGIGPAVWFNDKNNSNCNGTVLNNIIQGDNMGYGIVVSGSHNFTVLDNKSTAKYSGAFTSSCYKPNNAPPMLFLKSLRADGNLQSDFVIGRAQYVICIEPGLSGTYTYQAGQLNLYSSDQITLQNANFTLQNDGNLVLYQNNSSKWSSNTNGHDCNNKQCRLTFNSESQLVIYQNNQTIASWPTDYNNSLGLSSIRIANETAYFTFFDGNGSVIFASSYDFYRSFHLQNGSFVRQTFGNTFIYLTLLNDGNLAIYSGAIKTGTLLWSTSLSGKTCTKNGCYLSFQVDGNLVIYSDQGALWATGTNPSGTKLMFNPMSPYLQVYNSSNAIIWHS